MFTCLKPKKPEQRQGLRREPRGTPKYTCGLQMGHEAMPKPLHQRHAHPRTASKNQRTLFKSVSTVTSYTASNIMQ